MRPSSLSKVRPVFPREVTEPTRVVSRRDTLPPSSSPEGSRPEILAALGACGSSSSTASGPGASDAASETSPASPVTCGAATCPADQYCFHGNDCPGTDAGPDAKPPPCGPLAPFCGALPGDCTRSADCCGVHAGTVANVDAVEHQVSCVNE